MNESAELQKTLTDSERALLSEVMEDIVKNKSLSKLSQEKLSELEKIRQKLEAQKEKSEDIERARKILQVISIVGRGAALGGGVGAVAGAILGTGILPGVGTILGAA